MVFRLRGLYCSGWVGGVSGLRAGGLDACGVVPGVRVPWGGDC